MKAMQPTALIACNQPASLRKRAIALSMTTERRRSNRLLDEIFSGASSPLSQWQLRLTDPLSNWKRVS